MFERGRVRCRCFEEVMWLFVVVEVYSVIGFSVDGGVFEC